MDYSDQLYQLIIESKFVRNEVVLDDICRRIKDLFDKNPTVGNQEFLGILPLHQAAAWSPLPVVKTVYDLYSTTIQKTNNYGHLPLHIAAANNPNEDVIALLVEKYPQGRSVVATGAKQTALHKIPRLGLARSSKILDLLVDGCEETLLLRDVYGETPLMSFVKQTERGYCPVHLCHALREKTIDYAKKLFDRRHMTQFVDLFHTSFCWDVPLLGMCLHRWPEFFRLDIVRGMTPIHIICSMPYFHDQQSTIKFFVDNDPHSLILIDGYGRTPVHYLVTAQVCSRRLLEYIIEKNTDVLLVEDIHGMTPLFAAASADATTDVVNTLFCKTAFHPGSNLVY